MAVVRGTSGALKDVRNSALSVGFAGAEPTRDALTLHRSKLVRDRDDARDRAAAAVAAEIERWRDLETHGDPEADADDAIQAQRIEHEATRTKERLEALRRRSGLLSWIANLVRVPRLRREATAHAHRLAVVRRRSAERRQATHDARELFEHDAQHEIARRCGAAASRLTALDELLASSELAGAHAESAVIECLRGLPDTFHVLNDLRVEADHFLRFNGKQVKSAQVDHLVVGPTGVFVIETKNWSRSFVESGAYFDPFDQVGRAGLLCYCILNDRRLSERAETLLVPTGAVPATPAWTKTRVVRPDGLVAYLRSRSATLAKEQVQGIVAFLWSSYGSGDATDAPPNAPPQAGVPPPVPAMEAGVRNHVPYGACVRCAAQVPLDQRKPLCTRCYGTWKRYGDADYPEKHCHGCGARNKTSFARPLCSSCARSTGPR